MDASLGLLPLSVSDLSPRLSRDAGASAPGQCSLPSCTWPPFSLSSSLTLALNCAPHAANFRGGVTSSLGSRTLPCATSFCIHYSGVGTSLGLRPHTFGPACLPSCLPGDLLTGRPVAIAATRRHCSITRAALDPGLPVLLACLQRPWLLPILPPPTLMPCLEPCICPQSSAQPRRLPFRGNAYMQ